MRGYICIAQNTDEVDYLRQAYALALSIKLSQSSVKQFAICVDERTKNLIENKHRQVFDYIIDIPWGDQAEFKEWKIHNKWKYFHMTPFEETVILDADMIFPTDVSYWWDILEQQDVWVTTKVRTYRDEIVTSDYYRKYFALNDLPNVYTAFMYFKKSELASELFAMTEIVFQHWQRFFYKYMPNGKPDYLSGDVAYALAMKLLGIEADCTRENVDIVPTFVHMKSHVQNARAGIIAEKWTDTLPTYYVDHANFKIANFQQTLPFHYVEKDWITDTMIERMEQLI